jgi:phage repressor protein C with HTH and peptisase S24 domain
MGSFKEMFPNKNEICFFEMLHDSNGMEPTILQHDHLAVDQGDTEIIDGKVYILQVKGVEGVIVRQLFHSDGEIILHADNPEHENLRAKPSEFEVVGRVIRYLRDL